ncbi:MAG: Rpn family recombination-promoting nuclease/putative transposase [Saprospiraceae bacterium]
MSKKRLSHDAFFKKAFMDIDVARDFIRNFLPENLVSTLNLVDLKLSNQSFVTPQLKQYFSDLVYKCTTTDEEPIELALLFEHKYNAPAYPHLQLLRYLLEYWEVQIKQKEALTPIIPIVVYQGKHKWQQKPFYSYFKSTSPLLHAYIPNFEYLLTDINQMEDGDILALKAELLSNILLLMKHIQTFPPQYYTRIFIGIENQIHDRAKRNLFEGMIVYFLQNVELSRTMLGMRFK